MNCSMMNVVCFKRPDGSIRDTCFDISIPPEFETIEEGKTIGDVVAPFARAAIMEFLRSDMADRLKDDDDPKIGEYEYTATNGVRLRLVSFREAATA